jgi:metal transporter CNNM
MSGLTVGFMGLDPIILEIQEKNGTQKQKKYLKRILYMLSKHHWLLVTLLLCNSFAAETMPIVLHKIISEVPAIIISVILLLFFGEIIPMALCTGPNQMKLIKCFYPLIYFLMIITYIISYPIALLMDKIIGKQEKIRFNNDELKELIKLHDKSLINKNNLNNKNIGLNSIQIKIIQNIIDLEEKQIKNIMKNYDNIKKYEKNEQLSINKIKNIKKDKKDFVPIYENNINNIIGVLNINELIDLENKTNFNELYIKEPIFFNINNNNILNILEILIKKKKKFHLM